MATNYFEIFGLKVEFDIDQSALEKSYIDLIKTYHPDKFSDESQKKIAYQNTLTIDTAYKIISDEVSRAEYILSLNNILVGTENDYIKPEQNFLVYLIEIEESLESSDNKNDLEDILKREKNNYAEYITLLKKSLNKKDYVEAANNAIKMRYTRKLITKIEEKLAK